MVGALGLDMKKGEARRVEAGLCEAYLGCRPAAGGHDRERNESDEEREKTDEAKVARQGEGLLATTMPWLDRPSDARNGAEGARRGQHQTTLDDRSENAGSRPGRERYGG
jgi:hypothetical protein